MVISKHVKSYFYVFMLLKMYGIILQILFHNMPIMIYIASIFLYQ